MTRAPIAWPFMAVLSGCSLLFSLDGYEGAPDAGHDARPRMDASTSADVTSHDVSKPSDAHDASRPPPKDSGAKDVGIEAAVCTSPFTNAVLSDKPLAYYPMDELSSDSGLATMHDRSGNNPPHDGTYGSGVVLGTAGLVASEPGEKAPHFPGGVYDVNNTVQVPLSLSLEPGPSFSVEFLFEEDEPNPGPDDAAGNDGYVDMVILGWSAQLTPTNTLKFYLPTEATGTYLGATETATQITVGQPHLLDAAYGNNSVAMYLDGVFVASAGSTFEAGGPRYSTDAGLTIDGALTLTRAGLQGKIAQVSLYASVLTSEQIQRHYAALSGCVTGDATAH